MLLKALAFILLGALMACKVAPLSPAPARAEVENKAASLSDAELQRRVEGLFVEADPGRENLHILMAAGKRAVPFVVRALEDPRTQTAQFPRAGFSTVDKSPFGRLCGLLTHTPAPEAAKPLARYVQNPNPDFRAEAAATLGRIAAPECIEPMKKALADPDRHVRQFALIGISAGIRETGPKPEFLNATYDSVAALMKDGEYGVVGPAMLLAQIDGPRAAPMLESRAYFNTHNPQLHDVLTGLNFEGHKTPHAILMPLMKELAPAAAGNGRRALQFAAALKLYARNPGADAEATFRSLSDSENDTVAVGAASALEILAGVNTGAVLKLGHDGNFATMSTAQRYYFAVSEYHFEVCNGGHDQFFGNSAGNLYPTVLEGLHAIGAHQKASILQEAIHAFGERVETDRTQRQLQMEHLPGAAQALFKSADQRYFDSEKRAGERVEVLLSLFAVNYPAEFGKK